MPPPGANTRQAGNAPETSEDSEISEGSEGAPGTMTVLTHGKFIKLFFKIARPVGSNGSENSDTRLER